MFNQSKNNNIYQQTMTDVMSDNTLQEALIDFYEHLIFCLNYICADFAAEIGESPIAALAVNNSDLQTWQATMLPYVQCHLADFAELWQNLDSVSKLNLISKQLSSPALSDNLKNSMLEFFTDTNLGALSEENLAAVRAEWLAFLPDGTQIDFAKRYLATAANLPDCPAAADTVAANSGLAALLNHLIQAFYTLPSLLYACNVRELAQDFLGHSELYLLKTLGRITCNRRLNNYSIFVNLEPCLLCMAAVISSQLGAIHYFALDAKAGAAQSQMELAAQTWLNYHPTYLFHANAVFNNLTAHQLKKFFRNLRKQNKALNQALGGRKQRSLLMQSLDNCQTAKHNFRANWQAPQKRL